MVRNFWLSAWADENQQRQQFGAEGGNRTGSDFLDSEAFRLGVYAAFGIGEGGQWHPSFLYWVTIRVPVPPCGMGLDGIWYGRYQRGRYAVRYQNLSGIPRGIAVF